MAGFRCTQTGGLKWSGCSVPDRGGGGGLAWYRAKTFALHLLPPPHHWAPFRFHWTQMGSQDPAYRCLWFVAHLERPAKWYAQKAKELHQALHCTAVETTYVRLMCIVVPLSAGIG